QLNINNAAALGSGTFTIGGGTIDNTSGASITLNNIAQSWRWGFSFLGANHLNMGTGAITLTASVVVTVTAGALALGGVISGGFSLTKSGSGNETLFR